MCQIHSAWALTKVQHFALAEEMKCQNANKDSRPSNDQEHDTLTFVRISQMLSLKFLGQMSLHCLWQSSFFIAFWLRNLEMPLEHQEIFTPSQHFWVLHKFKKCQVSNTLCIQSQKQDFFLCCFPHFKLVNEPAQSQSNCARFGFVQCFCDHKFGKTATHFLMWLGTPLVWKEQKRVCGAHRVRWFLTRRSSKWKGECVFHTRVVVFVTCFVEMVRSRSIDCWWLIWSVVGEKNDVSCRQRPQEGIPNLIKGRTLCVDVLSSALRVYWVIIINLQESNLFQNHYARFVFPKDASCRRRDDGNLDVRRGCLCGTLEPAESD